MDLMLEQQYVKADGVEEQVSSSSECSHDSDSSFDLENKINNKSHQKKLTNDLNGDDQKKNGKFGLKYAKISNKQRQALIERVTSTGCTIKSAAKDLSINFSTAKAIMQIFRREGRITKKIIREIKSKTIKNLGQNNEDNIQKKSQLEEQNLKFVKVEAIQDNNETNLYQQAEEANRHQALIIQQLSTQNLYLQSRINQLQQDKFQINSKYEQLLMQYHQLQSMARQFLQPCMFQFPTFAQ
ncbi:unnamed protein product (macronuclear) [Paramecium tetraurelia]|uniref:HTH psq-type domain-containing protein n=1 Tax=Paramecium tetraurelia TaxID=5888 RepID=A0BCF9_PARTE|nr:uncharacterized protein GSPATT00004320001 [Paramecium tetraurelia]CAK56226.1 unnamed protein product [Paramecium tetraurelia]|eukprot:XP_001423624.1 hypothetical protein (macronuclear) [Paramecium tetraurelia strain d4-2]